MEKALGRHEDTTRPVTPVATGDEEKLKELLAGFRPSVSNLAFATASA